MAMSRPTYGRAWGPSEKFISKHWVGWNIAWSEISCWRYTDLKGLDKSPEERSNAFSFTEQFHQPQNSEQAEERDGHFSTFTFALKRNKYSDKQKQGVDLYTPCRYYLNHGLHCNCVFLSYLTMTASTLANYTDTAERKNTWDERDEVWFET